MENTNFVWVAPNLLNGSARVPVSLCTNAPPSEAACLAACLHQLLPSEKYRRVVGVLTSRMFVIPSRERVNNL